MLFHFSAYGFLKNQRYFEPFMLLFLMSRGMSYTQIGLLLGFRELCTALLEIPSGALADLYGRKRSMIFSFCLYIFSFAGFGLSGRNFWQLFAAMILFAAGDAFRTGTHKALIFSWLRRHNRLEEKTKIYGYTRSWSKTGSAVSIAVAVWLMTTIGDYAAVFFISIIPYVLGLVNFLFYPKELDDHTQGRVTMAAAAGHVKQAVLSSFTRPAQRRLLVESICFEGFFKAVKDYIQPIIQSFAVVLPVLAVFDFKDRSSIGIGIVYFLLHIVSAAGSRMSHKIVDMQGSEDKAAQWVWKASFLLYAAMIPFFITRQYSIAVILFVLVHILQNIWRPVLISRFHLFSTDRDGATVLSIESQAKSFGAMIFAPIAGAVVDYVKIHGWGGEFWPVAVLGAGISAVMLVYGRRKNADAAV